MKHGSAPLLWDIDASGNTAPQVTPSASVSPVTFNLSGLDGRTEDLWNYIAAIWVRVTFVLTSGGAGAVLNRDVLGAVVDSFNLYSPILGDLLAQKSNQGAAVYLIDSYIGAGYNRPHPIAAQIPLAAGDTTCDVYFRIPLELDMLGRPRDTGVWAPLLEKGKLVVNISPTTADFFQTSFNVKAAAATVRAAFEVVPQGAPQIHAPSKFVRYEFPTAGTQLKILSFGNGDGMLGVNPGARLSMLLWLSSNKKLGGVDTIEKWTRVSLPWRHQRVINNPDFLMGSYIAGTRTRGVVGSVGAAAVNDGSGTPYIMGADVPNSLLDSDGLFFPIVWPGYDSDLSSQQKQVGDLQIDAGFSANPNGTHVFRTLEHYSWQPTMVAKIMGLMGYDTQRFTAEPKTHDNTDPRMISDGQLWGLPLRIVERNRARKPVL
jgi:hypothetical protein